MPLIWLRILFLMTLEPPMARLDASMVGFLFIGMVPPAHGHTQVALRIFLDASLFFPDIIAAFSKSPKLTS